MFKGTGRAREVRRLLAREKLALTAWTHSTHSSSWPRSGCEWTVVYSALSSSKPVVPKAASASLGNVLRIQVTGPTQTYCIQTFRAGNTSQGFNKCSGDSGGCSSLRPTSPGFPRACNPGCVAIDRQLNPPSIFP